MSLASSPWCSRTRDGCLQLLVHVLPGAKHSRVAGQHDGALKIRIAAPAQDNRANEALIAFLAEQLGLARTQVEIAAGWSSRRKRVLISKPPADAEFRLLGTD